MTKKVAFARAPHCDLFAALRKTDISVIMLCAHFQLSPEGHMLYSRVYKVRRRVIIRLAARCL